MTRDARVRLRMWAKQVAWSEVDLDYDYTPEQWARIERNVEQRIEWLEKIGPRPRPTLSEQEREAFWRRAREAPGQIPEPEYGEPHVLP